MNIDKRKRAVLKVVVESYIESADPVGSKTLSQLPELNFSSATLRNEMAALESMGLLEQLHTSSGRVPTPSGYRLYVDELMTKHDITPAERDKINEVKNLQMSELNSLLSRAGKIISELTKTVTVAAAGPSIREEQVYVSGEANLFDYPEFQNLLRMKRTLEYITEQRAEFIRKSPIWEEDGVRVAIGPENAAEELSDASVLMATYPVGEGVRGMIGVVGPIRMDYSKMVSRLSYFAGKLSEITAKGV